MNRYHLESAMDAHRETHQCDIAKLFGLMLPMLVFAIFIPLLIGFPLIVSAAWFGLVSSLIFPAWAQSFLHHHSLWFWLVVSVPVLVLAIPALLCWQSGNHTQSNKGTVPFWIVASVCGLAFLLRFSFAGLAISDCLVLSVACALILPTGLEMIAMWWVLINIQY